jgi:predicted PurR-regulated permease PerM
MDNTFKIPFYAKAALIFISVFALVYTLHIGQNIIVPIIYATIIAILLNPLVNYLNSKNVNNVVSISIAVALAIVVVAGLLYIISTQLSMFGETYPQLKAKFNSTSIDLVRWISNKFSIRKSKINAWIAETQSEAIDDYEIGEKISEIWEMVVIIMLLPVYLFMILYYKTLLLEFVRKLFRTEHHTAVIEVLNSSKKIIQSYLIGLFVEFVIVAILNSAGLLVLGIDYAIILGITGALLNIIPYIGGVIAILLPMIIAFATKDSIAYPLLVLGLYTIIQLIDNNYIIPMVVASKVKINALASVVVVIIGGAIWGVSGMFLSILLAAIMKVIFDHVESLKPWGFLLGNIVPTKTKFSFVKIQKPPSNPKIPPFHPSQAEDHKTVIFPE